MKSLDEYQKNSFWNKYVLQLKKRAIKKSVEPWYIIHVEQYTKSIPNLKLRYHTAENLNQYFSLIGRNKEVEGWQFYQQVEALEILFCDVLNVDWCKQIDWDYWYSSAKELEITPPIKKLFLTPVNNSLQYF